jgi:hypothetical protein
MTDEERARTIANCQAGLERIRQNVAAATQTLVEREDLRAKLYPERPLAKVLQFRPRVTDAR